MNDRKTPRREHRGLHYRCRILMSRDHNYIDALNDLTQAYTTGAEFRLECESPNGDRLTSNHAYLVKIGLTTPADPVPIEIRTREASLQFATLKNHEASVVAFFLVGFRPMGHCNIPTNLGALTIGSQSDEAPLDQITGALAICADRSEPVADWHKEAECLLVDLLPILCFAHGSRLPVRVKKLVCGNNVKLIFQESGAGHTPETPPIISAAPIIETAIKHIDDLRKHRKKLNLAISWLLVRATMNEVRFLSGMVALESLAAQSLPKSRKSILPEKQFKRLLKRLKEAIDDQICVDENLREAVKNKLPDLNRYVLRGQINSMFQQWNISPRLIGNDEINDLIKTRNLIVHTGNANEEVDVWSQIVVVREILARFVLSLICFKGQYQCYINEYHPRSFPECERID